MSGAVEKMETGHMRARATPHFVDRAGRLIHAPIALPRDELRRDIDRASCKGLHFGDTSGIGTPSHAIALQRASETGPAVFGRVHFDLGLGKPFALRDVI